MPDQESDLLRTHHQTVHPPQSPGEWPAAVRELVASREADAAEAAAADVRRDAESAEEATEAETERLRQAAARAQHSARQAEAARCERYSGHLSVFSLTMQENAPREAPQAV